jgi:hypothetical protein
MKIFFIFGMVLSFIVIDSSSARDYRYDSPDYTKDATSCLSGLRSLLQGVDDCRRQSLFSFKGEDSGQDYQKIVKYDDVSKALVLVTPINGTDELFVLPADHTPLEVFDTAKAVKQKGVYWSFGSKTVKNLAFYEGFISEKVLILPPEHQNEVVPPWDGQGRNLKLDLNVAVNAGVAAQLEHLKNDLVKIEAIKNAKLNTDTAIADAAALPHFSQCLGRSTIDLNQLAAACTGIDNSTSHQPSSELNMIFDEVKNLSIKPAPKKVTTPGTGKTGS